MYNIKFIRENLEFQASPGMNLLEAERKAGLMPDAPCGGQGKCGKCRVKIDGKVVLACKTVVDRDMEVDTLKGDSGYEILTEGFKRPILFDPDLKQQKVFLKKPDMGDNRSEWERLVVQLHTEKTVKPDLQIASELYEYRKEAEEWYVVYTEDEILNMLCCL